MDNASIIVETTLKINLTASRKMKVEPDTPKTDPINTTHNKKSN